VRGRVVYKINILSVTQYHLDIAIHCFVHKKR